MDQCTNAAMERNVSRKVSRSVVWCGGSPRRCVLCRCNRMMDCTVMLTDCPPAPPPPVSPRPDSARAMTR